MLLQANAAKGQVNRYQARPVWKHISPIRPGVVEKGSIYKYAINMPSRSHPEVFGYHPSYQPSTSSPVVYLQRWVQSRTELPALPAFFGSQVHGTPWSNDDLYIIGAGDGMKHHVIKYN